MNKQKQNNKFLSVYAQKPFIGVDICRHNREIRHDVYFSCERQNSISTVKKGKATLFIHGLCLKLEARGGVYMKQKPNKQNIKWSSAV